MNKTEIIRKYINAQIKKLLSKIWIRESRTVLCIDCTHHGVFLLQTKFAIPVGR